MTIGTYKDWDVHLSRSDITRLSDSERQLPRWATEFVRQARTGTLIDALDRAVDNVLVESDAIDPKKPPNIWLLRVAERLGATVRWLHEPRAKAMEPIATDAPKRGTGWQRGIVRAETDGGWNVLIGNARSTSNRYDLAHELGHAMLYRREDRIDLETWQSTRWNAPEEACCNYLARRMLVPPALMPDPATGDNLATFTIDRVQRHFQIPLKVATYRLLDAVAKSDSAAAEAVILWRQYHPLDRYLLLATFRDRPELCRRVTTLALRVLSAIPHSTFRDARLIWEDVLAGRPSQGSAPSFFQDLPPETYAFADQNSAADLSIMRERLLGKLPQFSFRPEWVAWHSRPTRHFVPLKKGLFRINTMVARLACGRQRDEESCVEDVSIGCLSGSYRLNGFADGDSAIGHRYILQFLRKHE